MATSTKKKWIEYDYPERVYRFCAEDVYSSFYNKEYGVPEKYNSVIAHIVEDELFNNPYFTEREREAYIARARDGLTYKNAAAKMGVTTERVRQIVLKMERKLHKRSILRRINVALEVVINENREFAEAHGNYNHALITMDEWNSDQVYAVKKYLFEAFYDGSNKKQLAEDDQFLRHGAFSVYGNYAMIIDAVVRKGIIIEDLFCDVSYEVSELLNWFFMEHPFILDDAPEDTLPSTLYIDYNEVIRVKRSRPVLNEEEPEEVSIEVIEEEAKNDPKPSIRDLVKTFLPDDGIEYGDVFKDEFFPIKDLGDGFTLSPFFYSILPQEKAAVWYLRDIKVVNKYDRMLSNYDDSKLLMNFEKALSSIITDPDTIKYFYAALKQPNKEENDLILRKIGEMLRDNADEFRSIMFDPTKNTKAIFMEAVDTRYDKYYKTPVQLMIEPSQMTLPIKKMLDREDIRTYRELLEKVLCYDITTASVENDKASIRALNRLMARVPFINYTRDGDEKKFNIKNITICHLKSMGENDPEIQDVFDYKVTMGDIYGRIDLGRNIAIYNLMVTNDRTVDALNKANIKTVADFVRAIRENDVDLCLIEGITKDDVMNLLIYAAYINNDLTVLQY